MTLHPGRLTESQRQVLASTAAVLSPLGFYLAGGVALALQLDHRQSEDLDWFRQEPVNPRLLVEQMRDAGVSGSILREAQDTLYLDVRGVPLSAMRYRYPLLAPTVPAADFGCELASIVDIGCMKLSAICGRTEKKDYFDLAVIARSGFPLLTFLDAYELKFEGADVYSVVAALTYFDDVELSASDISELERKGIWAGVKKTLLQWVRTMERERKARATRNK